ncbi:MAG: hypothetical protein HC852_01465 [Acaryochloridaceae cyanobacterium RU_4_10]|nr:hypothetical protein [Acaryochloridaceae cyanobacterium RU_4_10]
MSASELKPFKPKDTKDSRPEADRELEVLKLLCKSAMTDKAIATIATNTPNALVPCRSQPEKHSILDAKTII